MMIMRGTNVELLETKGFRVLLYRIEMLYTIYKMVVNVILMEDIWKK